MGIKRVKAGDPLRFPASAWNAFADAADAHRALKRAMSAGELPALREPDIVLVKNSTGASRDRFDVLGIDAPLFIPSDNEDEFKNNVSLEGVTPTDADHTGKVVILLEPLPSNGIGRAVLSGLTVCHVDVTDVSHGYADVKDGDATTLESAHRGAAQLLWTDSTSGSDWAVVRLGVPPVPFNAIIGGCMIESADPNAQHPDTYQATNPMLGGVPDPNDEEQLLLKFRYPFDTTTSTLVVVRTAHQVDWSPINGAAPGVQDVTVRYRWALELITEDFEYTGGSCAKWSDNLATAQSKDCEILIQVHDWWVQNVAKQLDWQGDESGSPLPLMTQGHGYSAGDTVYGVKLKVVSWTSPTPFITLDAANSIMWAITGLESGGFAIIDGS